MAIVPEVAVQLGLVAGATIPAQYMVLDDPSQGLLGTAELAPDNLMADVTDYLTSFTCSRGVSRVSGPLIQYEAGQATITLVNQDGRFDPDNYAGPYAGMNGWNVSTVGTPADGSYFTVTQAASLGIFTGDWVRFGTAPGAYLVTAIGNPSGGNVKISITPSAPSPVTADTAARYASLLTPQVAVRIFATWANISYAVWSGFVSDWDPQYSGPEASYCALTAVDGMTLLAQEGLRIALTVTVGAGELAGARINRILDSAGWPAGPSWRDIDTGYIRMDGTLLDGPPLTELQVVADSELGAFFIGRDGRATFRDRHALVSRPGSVTSQGVFGSGPGELPYSDRTLEHQTARLVNMIIAGRNGSSVTQTLSDPVSLLRYGPRVYQRSDLVMQLDIDVFQWASLLLYQNKDPEQWYTALVVDPRLQPDTLCPQVLARDIGDRITANRRPPGMPAISRDSFVRGISHEYSRASWKTTWATQSALKYSFLILDSGELDRDKLGG